MATRAVVTYDGGKIEVPPELERDLQLTQGTRLRISKASPRAILLELDQRFGELGATDWRSYEGILASHPEHDTTAARDLERALERQLDEQQLA